MGGEMTFHASKDRFLRAAPFQLYSKSIKDNENQNVNNKSDKIHNRTVHVQESKIQKSL